MDMDDRGVGLNSLSGRIVTVHYTSMELEKAIFWSSAFFKRRTFQVPGFLGKGWVTVPEGMVHEGLPGIIYWGEKMSLVKPKP